MTTRTEPTTAPLPPELDVLVVAPHPDDAEISMAGAILHLLAQGQRVGILDLTDGEPTPRGTTAIRHEETVKASSILDITWRAILDCRIVYCNTLLRLGSSLPQLCVSAVLRGFSHPIGKMLIQII